MTRETKIGLLVGLAFIIVIGILLSDVVRNDVPQANISVVGNSVRGGTGLFPSNNPPIAATAPNPSPDQQVPTREETGRRGVAVSDISIANGGAGPRIIQDHASMPRQQDAPDPHPGVMVDDGGNTSIPLPGPAVAANDPQNRQITPPASNDPRYRAARSGQEELVPASSGSSDNSEANYVADRTGPSPARAAQTRRDSVAQTQQITAGPGDTLSRLAGRYMGANTKGNRDAIIKANSSLLQDPNKIIAGRIYVIPSAPPAAASASAGTSGSDMPAATPAAPAPAAPVATATDSSSGYWYVVQPGDSLIRIARDQLGDPDAYVAIKELNNDTLKGGDTVRPDMKLRLPAKPLAMAR